MIPRTLFDADLEGFRDSVRKFLEQEATPYHDQWEKDGQVSRELWQKAGELGFLCPCLPEEFGGVGADFRYSAVLIEEVARAGLTGIGWGLHSDIVAPYVLNYGSDELKNHYLPKLASGEMIGAIAMTEPGAGSDLQGIRTTAIKDGNHLVVNGSKTYITNGQNADVIIVVAKTDPAQGAKGTSLVLVDADTEGFERGRNLDKIGQHSADTSELFFNDVRVPMTNILGGEGRGFIHLMEELPQERLGIAVGAQAAAQRAFDEAVKFTKDRQAFGKTVFEFQNTKFVLADLKAKLQVGWAHLDHCLTLHAKRTLTPEEGAAAKLWHTDLQWEMMDKCLQLHGGAGYMNEYPIARMWRSARVTRIFGGTNEIMKELIGRSL